MLKRKRSRDKGKISFTKFFQAFSPGDSVAVVRDLGLAFDYPKQIQGRTGKVIEKRGAAYHVVINHTGKEKTYFILPIHLKKLEAKHANPN